jgi:hypothetical protein
MVVVRSICVCGILDLILLATTAPAVDRLILRNLDIVFERTVVSLDEDGVVLDGPRPGGGSRITWDEIERGRVAVDQQRFDRLLSELSGPLYRIRQRLKNGDYVAAGEPAESLYPTFYERKSQSAYLVCQAVMWSRLSTGKREAALEPYLRCYELLRTRAAVSGGLPGPRRLNTDAATAISAELAPIWFDAAAAKEELPKVQQVIRGLSQPRPEGAYVYYASLAIAAGEKSEAEKVLPLLMTGDMVWWRKLVEAEAELRPLFVLDHAGKTQDPHPNPLPEGEGTGGSLLRRLTEIQDSLPRACQPVGLLLQGMASTQLADENDVRAGVLALLTLPAKSAAEQPELAAAGLYHAARALDKLKDGREATILRQELRSRFAATHFGGLARGARERP